MKLKLALAAATALSASTAFATPVSLTYNGSSAGSETVSYSTTSPSFSGNAAASTFTMTDTTGGLGDFFAWCVDLSAYLGTQGDTNEYTITDTPFVSTFDFGVAVDRLANLFNANFSEDITTDSEKSAGFQLAIWESVYDDDFDITDGNFTGSSANSNVNGYATDYLAAANGFDGDAAWNLLFLESTPTEGDRLQNLVTVAAVPLPTSALMLLAALGAFGMTRRRQSA